MPANYTFNIDTSSNTLLAGTATSTPVAPSSIPLFFGDTISLVVFLLAPVASVAPSSPQFSIVPNAGLTLYLYLDDGTISGTIYTQQISWANNADNSFSANLALNTAALQTLLGSASAGCWLKIGYVQAGLITTVYSRQVTVNVGLPNPAVAPNVPAGLTPLTLEVARQMFVPLQPVAGQGIQIESAAGKIALLQVVDNPDGTASFDASPIN